MQHLGCDTPYADVGAPQDIFRPDASAAQLTLPEFAGSPCRRKCVKVWEDAWKAFIPYARASGCGARQRGVHPPDPAASSRVLTWAAEHGSQQVRGMLAEGPCALAGNRSLAWLAC